MSSCKCGGVKAERERIISYLVGKGILRQAMFMDGLVGRMVDTQNSEIWPIIDLPADLGAAQVNICTCNLAPQPCKSCQDHTADQAAKEASE